MHMARGIPRNGGDPRRWLELFLCDKNILPGERVVHELNTSVDALYYFDTVDQVNMGALVGVEVESV